MLVKYNGIRFLEGDTVTKEYATSLAKTAFEDFDENKLEFVLTRAELNRERNREIEDISAEITVEDKKVVLDADTQSIQNINLAVSAMQEDSEKTRWITIDNEEIELSRKDLVNALRDAAQKKSNIIFKYKNKKLGL